MKKSALAMMMTLAVASLATSVSQAAEVYNKDGNKLDMYGRVKAEHYLSDNNAVDGDQSYVRFGFKGVTQINDMMQGFGQWEYQIAANRAESDGATGTKTRLGFAGLKFSEFGSFDYGRNYGALYDVEAWTDMIPEFGGDSYTKADNFMTGRSTGLATYRNRDFFGLVDGLNFALQYQGKMKTIATLPSRMAMVTLYRQPMKSLTVFLSAAHTLLQIVHVRSRHPHLVTAIKPMLGPVA